VSRASTQSPQQASVVFTWPLVGSGREAGGDFHTRSELLMTRLARKCFFIAAYGIARGTTTLRYCRHQTFERNGSTGKGDGVARFDCVRGFHTLVIEMDPATTHRGGGSGTGFEQSDPE